MRLSIHELSSLQHELIWAYAGSPGSHHMRVQRRSDSGNWAWLLLSGVLEFKQKQSLNRVPAGHWIILPEGITEHHFTEDTKLLSIYFRCQWPTGDNLIRLKEPNIFHKDRFPMLLKRSMRLERFSRKNFPTERSHRDFHKQASDYTNFLQLQIYFIAWIKEWIQCMQTLGVEWNYFGTKDERLQTAIRILNEASLSSKLPLKRISSTTGLSRVHLDRLFVQNMGMTMRKHWDKRRWQKANDMLQDPDISIKALTYLLGFKSDSLFINWFRRRSGQSPGQHRKSQRSNSH